MMLSNARSALACTAVVVVGLLGSAESPRAQTPADTARASIDAAYRVGAEDVLEISVWREDTLKKEVLVMIAEERKTKRADLERSFELLAHSNLIGVVLNKSHELPEPEPITRPRPSAFRRFFGAEG